METERQAVLETYQTDVAVIGGGVIGIAVARALARRGLETIILEQNDLPGTQTSARNSEVIHAGLYYEPGSLKARLCVRGQELLYDYCAQEDIRTLKCGKLVVATDDAQIPDLEKILLLSMQNNVTKVEILERDELRLLEPELNAKAALHSPSTGVLDSAAFIRCLLGEAESHGAIMTCRARIAGGQLNDDLSVTLTVEGADRYRLRAKTIVNAAGLWSARVNNVIEGFSAVADLNYVKGNYFDYLGSVPFSHLIYPMPSTEGLGIHLTRSVSGDIRFGPDTEACNIGPDMDFDYRVYDTRKELFVQEIRTYWPGLESDRLVPAFSGIRPKVDDGQSDFVIDALEEGGMGPHVRLLGIDSPGLTSSLSIAEEVAEKVS